MAFITALELNFGLPMSNLVLYLTDNVCKAPAREAKKIECRSSKRKSNELTKLG